MKKVLFSIITVLTMSLVFTSCKKDEEVTPEVETKEDVRDAIVGNHWVSETAIYKSGKTEKDNGPITITKKGDNKININIGELDLEGTAITKHGNGTTFNIVTDRRSGAYTYKDVDVVRLEGITKATGADGNKYDASYATASKKLTMGLKMTLKNGDWIDFTYVTDSK